MAKLEYSSNMEESSPCSQHELRPAENGSISYLGEDREALLGFTPSGDDPAAHFSSLRRAQISLNEQGFENSVSGTDGLEIVIMVDREGCEDGFHNELLGGLDGVDVSVCLGNRDMTEGELVSVDRRAEAVMADGIANGRVQLAVEDSCPETRDGEIAIDKIPEFDNLPVDSVETSSAIAQGLIAERKRPRAVLEEMCRISKPRKIVHGTEEVDEAVKNSGEVFEVRECQIGGLQESVRVCRDGVERAQINARMEVPEVVVRSPDAVGEKGQEAPNIDAESKRTRETGSTEVRSPPMSTDQVDITRNLKPKLEDFPSGGLQGTNDASDSQVLPGVESDGDCMDETVCNKDNRRENDAGASRVRNRKRRKIAMLLAYCGAGYQGMQKNPGAVTIEGELEEALVKAQAMPENYDGNPRKVDWMRAARTDKGVSAVGQVVSGSFYIDPPGFVERVNTHLPKQIRLLGYKRVTPTFSAKKYCDRRRYEYVIPIFALDPNAHRDRESVLASEGKDGAFAKCQECSERGRKIPGAVSRGWGKSTSGEVESAMENGEVEKDVQNICKNEKIIEVKEENLINKTVDEDGPSGVATIGATQKVTSDEEVVPTQPDAIETQKREGTLSEKQSHSGIVRVEESSVLPSQEQCSSSESRKRDTWDFQSNSTGPEKVDSFHFGEAERERLNKILSHFVGTHNFHNYTTKVKAEDPSAKRYIVSFETGNVFTVGTTELVKCVVVGQSFMLHQIRKMIGLAIAIFRGCAPESMLDMALRRDVHINVPTAPELGLFLDECMYPAYNQKWYNTHEEVSQKGLEKEISCFKHDVIYEHIAALEHKEGLMALFLHSLNDRNYPDFVTAREAEKLRDNQLT